MWNLLLGYFHIVSYNIEFQSFLYRMQVTKSDAIVNAIKFFEQHNSNVLPVDASLKEGVWTVTVSIGLITKVFRKVRVDANHGKILGYD